MALGVACFCALVGSALFGEHGLLHLQKVQEDQLALEELAFQLQQGNERLRQHIHRLQHDDRYLERIARERLGLVRPGELVYRHRGAPPPTR